MNCEKCGLEMKVLGGRYMVSGDDSPDKKTKLQYVMQMACKNPSCTAKGQVVEISHNLQLDNKE